jgi:hypothetical protein
VQERWRRQQQQLPADEEAEEYTDEEDDHQQQQQQVNMSIEQDGQYGVSESLQQQDEQSFGFRSASAPPAAVQDRGTRNHSPAGQLEHRAPLPTPPPPPPAASAEIGGRAHPTKVYQASASAAAASARESTPAAQQHGGRGAYMGVGSDGDGVGGDGLMIGRSRSGVRPDGEGVGGDGLMCEVLAMQQNLQELEQDLLQLGCEFD